jgi:hypothetical protein
MMSPGEIRSAVSAQPFRPFTIHSSDGRSFRVGHPEVVVVHHKNRWVMVTHDDRAYAQMLRELEGGGQ